MIRFHHKGCTSEVIRYVGQQPLVAGMIMKAAEWQFPDCRHPTKGEPAICPDCSKLVSLTSRCLEPIPETAEA